MARLVVFFDGECALCNRAVRFLRPYQRFEFVSLQSEQAQKLLRAPVPLDSLILLEGEREWRYGKGALRICWHLGGAWKLLGLLSFLPRWLVDPIYRIIARHRHLFS